MQSLHLAIASTTSRPGDVSGNLAQIESFARRAGSDGADLLLTPELSVSGYGGYREVLATAETAGDGPIFNALAQLADETGVILGAGFVEAAPGRRYLAHYLVFPGGEFEVQRKYRVSATEAPLNPAADINPENVDARHPAIQFSLFMVRGFRCALVICADAGLSALDEVLMENGVDVLLLPTGAGGKRTERVTTQDLYTPAGRERYYQVLQTVFMPGRAPIDCLRFRRALAAVNLCGHDGRDHFHVGHGSIINAMGEVVAGFHGLPNLDRQRPLYAHAAIHLHERLDSAFLACRGSE